LRDSLGTNDTKMDHQLFTSELIHFCGLNCCSQLVLSVPAVSRNWIILAIKQNQILKCKWNVEKSATQILSSENIIWHSQQEWTNSDETEQKVSFLFFNDMAFR